MDKIYFTTPIYYINAEPHLGHTYTTVLADTLTRYYRSAGYEVYFLTGTDEHGDKIAQAAKEKGIEPKAYADRISAIFRSTWDACGIAYDHFIRTTDSYHQTIVRDFLQQIYDSGEIYFGEYAAIIDFAGNVSIRKRNWSVANARIIKRGRNTFTRRFICSEL